MCRMVAIRASEPVSARGLLVDDVNSLLAQSLGDANGMTHPDGWGLGFYQAGHREPGVIRSAHSAADDSNFLHTAGHVRSTMLVGHVRRASHGQRRSENSHPFQQGPWLFAHNGTVTGYERVEPRLRDETPPNLLAAREGQTDSELLFLWLLGRMRQTGIGSPVDSEGLETLTGLVRQATLDVAAWCREATGQPEQDASAAAFNFVLTDGRILLASRWNRSLHWTLRETAVEGRTATSFVVASEPIGGGQWNEIAEQGILTIEGDLTPHLHSF